MFRSLIFSSLLKIHFNLFGRDGGKKSQSPNAPEAGSSYVWWSIKTRERKRKHYYQGQILEKYDFFLTWKNETTPIINWPFFQTLVEIVLWFWPECWFLFRNLEVVAFIIMSAFSRTSQRVRHRCPLRAEIRSWTISGSVWDIKAGWTFDLWEARTNVNKFYEA